MRIDLLLAWDWPYDEPFVHLLASAFHARRLSLLSVTSGNLTRVLDGLSVGRYSVRAFLDRASDTSPHFQRLVRWAELNVGLRLNPSERARRAWVKSIIYPELRRAGVPLPYTVWVPGLRRRPDLPPLDLTQLGRPFCIKPDLGGGGWGVVTNAALPTDVEAARARLPNDDFVLHTYVEPETLRAPDPPGLRRAWFRVFYACGRIIPCWWDDRTHVFFGRVAEAECRRFNLGAIGEIMRTIAGVVQLHLFSTEIARVAPDRFIVVDYVNDPVDLRLQSHAHEGLPNAVAWELAEAIADSLVNR